MKRVITYGTFDLFHYGHLKILERAKSFGDFLIVAVSTDEFNRQKGKVSIYPFEHRKAIVEQIKFVDMVIPETSWEQKAEDIKKYNIDVFVIGDDWKGKFDYLKDLCEVIYLPRTSIISSTGLKDFINQTKNLEKILYNISKLETDKLAELLKFLENIRKIA